MNEDKRINFNVYYINDIYKWGYEVMDTHEGITLMRGYNYEGMDDAIMRQQSDEPLEQSDK